MAFFYASWHLACLSLLERKKGEKLVSPASNIPKCIRMYVRSTSIKQNHHQNVDVDISNPKEVSFSLLCFCLPLS
jgi:hypothetical protein